MPKTASRPKKPAANQKSSKPNISRPRKLVLPKRVWYNPATWQYRPASPAYKPLPKARVIFMASLRHVLKHKKVFVGIMLVFGLLDILLARGLGTGNLGAFKQTLDTSINNPLANATSSFLYLLTSSNNSASAASGVYQTILLVVCSLAFIWALRQTYADHTVRLRDSFYRGMYPLIPFFLVLLLLSVQLLPLALGASLYSMLVYNKILAAGWETLVALVGLVALALWSFRMITATIVALYVVTLPDMTPLGAYRSAKQLVVGRRLLIWRKYLFLPFVFLVVAAAVEIPLILFVTPVAEWVFFVLGMFALALFHTYYYALYREML